MTLYAIVSYTSSTHMSVSFLVKDKSTALRIVKKVLIAVPIFLLLFILNKNFAFTGVHRITISSFFHLPASVQYVGSAEVGVVSTPAGNYTRPYQDSIQFAVTLPRGFETMVMKVEFAADPFATVVLSAKTPVNAKKESAAFRLPSAYGTEWRSINLGNGLLYAKNNSEIQNADTFWKTFTTLKEVYSIGDGLANSIPAQLYAKGTQVVKTQVPGSYRGNLSIRAFFDGRPQQIAFDSRVAYGTSGKNSLRVTVERFGSIVAEKNITNNVRAEQHFTVDVPAGDAGFYIVRFQPSNEVSVVRNVQFVGSAVELSASLLLDQTPNPVTLFSRCTSLSIVAAHELGMQKPVIVNGQKVKLQSAIRSQQMQTPQKVNTIIFPRGDVRVSNACGFLITANDSLRFAYEEQAQRISVTAQLTSEVQKEANFIFDPLPTATVANRGEGTFSIEKTFHLSDLYAKGKTFTFSLEEPGLTKQTDTYLHLKNISFTAKRPPFSFSDVTKVFKALLKL
jgi:hypothetical protein